MRRHRDEYPGWLRWRWVFYFLWIFGCFNFLMPWGDYGRFYDSWTESNIPYMLIVVALISIALTFIIAIGTGKMKQPKNRGNWRQRTENEADVVGMTWFISIAFSILCAFGVLFWNMPVIAVLGIEGVLVGGFGATSFELALFQYTMKEQWWLPVFRTALALFVPPLAVAVIVLFFWVLSCIGSL